MMGRVQPALVAIRRTALAAALFVLAPATGCRCYHVGNQYSWRSDIRTVHVAIAESDSYRRFSGQKLTEAMIREITLRTPLTIADPATADSILQARILRDTKQVLGENRFDDPRVVAFRWTLEVTWVDRAGTPLMQRQLIRLEDDSTFVPEGGQSLATAELSLLERLAREIVGQMEMPW